MWRAQVGGTDSERVGGLATGDQGLLKTYDSRTFLDGKQASSRVLERIQDFAIHALDKQQGKEEGKRKKNKRIQR